MKPLKHYEREALIWGADLSANEKILLLALNSFVDGNGECYPGLETLARMTGLTERTCRTVRDKLKAKGLIQTFRRTTEQGFRTSDRYKVDFSAFPHLPENCVSLPEGSSTRESSLPENCVSLPENCVSPTGKLRQNLPEGFSRDLSSKNYPVRTIQIEPSPLTPQGGEEGGGANFSNSESEPTEQGESPAVPPRPVSDPTAAAYWPRPWRTDGQLSPAFCEYVGNLFPGDSNKHPRTKGRNHIINLERSGDPSNWEKLNGYWDDYNQPEESAEGGDDDNPLRYMFAMARNVGKA